MYRSRQCCIEYKHLEPQNGIEFENSQSININKTLCIIIQEQIYDIIYIYIYLGISCKFQ